MEERDFFEEKSEQRTHLLTCPHCGKADDYPLGWLVRRRKSGLAGGALTAAALAVCSEVAWANLITQTQTFGPAPTTWMHTFSFAGFDTSLGTLTQVSDTVTEQLSGTVSFVNNGPVPAFVFGNLINTGSKSLPGLSISLVSISNTVFAGPLAMGESSGPLDLAGTNSSSVAITSGLSSYEGASATVMGNAMDTSMNTFASSTGTATATVNNMGEITDVLVYTFTPPFSAPEPSTLAVLSGGLVGVFLTYKRRRSRRIT